MQTYTWLKATVHSHAFPISSCSVRLMWNGIVLGHKKSFQSTNIWPTPWAQVHLNGSLSSTPYIIILLYAYNNRCTFIIYIYVLSFWLYFEPAEPPFLPKSLPFTPVFSLLFFSKYIIIDVLLLYIYIYISLLALPWTSRASILFFIPPFSFSPLMKASSQTSFLPYFLFKIPTIS